MSHRGIRLTDTLTGSNEGDGVVIPNTGVDTLVHSVPPKSELVLSMHICHHEAGSGQALMKIKINGVLAISLRMSRGSVFDYGPVTIFGEVTGKDVTVSMTGSADTLCVTGQVEYAGEGRKFRA